jgi:erythromycin esterase-like protein
VTILFAQIRTRVGGSFDRPTAVSAPGSAEPSGSVWYHPFHANMRKPWLLRFFVLLLIFAGAAFVRAAAQTATLATEDKEIEPVVHALCGKRVALLGESPVHGFGEALKFKVELVHRLVEECHYDALFVESGIYDYINIEKKVESGQEVTGAMISAAIGGMWANKEVQSLVPFLREKVMAGTLTLGGLDDQIGAGSYASREMWSDLVQSLQGDERSRCLAILQKHLRWQYTDDAPYGPSDKTKIVGCLDEINGRLSQPGESKKSWAEEDKAMIDSLKRNLARNFTEDDFTKSDQELKWTNDRDRSMYLNFEWRFSRLPRNSKVIVWAATVHVAKDLSGVTGFEGRVPFGSYINRDFGDRAFSLGFSAYSGEYEFIHPPVKQLSPAPVSSLEGQVFAHRDSDTMYLSRKQLRKSGTVAARLLGTGFNTAHWDQVVDGLVVFRKERAPAWLNR